MSSPQDLRAKPIRFRDLQAGDRFYFIYDLIFQGVNRSYLMTKIDETTYDKNGIIRPVFLTGRKVYGPLLSA